MLVAQHTRAGQGLPQLASIPRLHYCLRCPHICLPSSCLDPRLLLQQQCQPCWRWCLRPSAGTPFG
jgi:hypothetical protein